MNLKLKRTGALFVLVCMVFCLLATCAYGAKSPELDSTVIIDGDKNKIKCDSCNNYVIEVNEDGLCPDCAKYFEEGGTVNPLPDSGEITHDDRGFVVCHICGKAFEKLGQHLKDAHSVTVKEYTERFDIDKEVLEDMGITIEELFGKVEDKSKDKDDQSVKSPQTGDNSYTYLVFMAIIIVSIALACTGKTKKNVE